MRLVRIGIILAILLVLAAPVMGQADDPVWESTAALAPCTVEDKDNYAWLVVLSDGKAYNSAGPDADRQERMVELYNTISILDAERWEPLRDELIADQLDAYHNLFFASGFIPCREHVAYQIAYHNYMLKTLLGLYVGRTIDHSEETDALRAARKRMLAFLNLSD